MDTKKPMFPKCNSRVNNEFTLYGCGVCGIEREEGREALSTTYNNERNFVCVCV